MGKQTSLFLCSFANLLLPARKPLKPDWNKDNPIPHLVLRLNVFLKHFTMRAWLIWEISEFMSLAALGNKLLKIDFKVHLVRKYIFFFAQINLCTCSKHIHRFAPFSTKYLHFYGLQKLRNLQPWTQILLENAQKREITIVIHVHTE